MTKKTIEWPVHSALNPDCTMELTKYCTIYVACDMKKIMLVKCQRDSIPTTVTKIFSAGGHHTVSNDDQVQCQKLSLGKL